MKAFLNLADDSQWSTDSDDSECVSVLCLFVVVVLSGAIHTKSSSSDFSRFSCTNKNYLMKALCRIIYGSL